MLSKRQRARKKKVMFLKDIIDPCQKDVLYEIKSTKINHQIEYDMKYFGVGSSQASKDLAILQATVRKKEYAIRKKQHRHHSHHK